MSADSERNIFIDGLRFGVSQLQRPMTFNMMIGYLTNVKKYTIEESYKAYLRNWFFTNFYHHTLSYNFRFGFSTTDAADMTEGRWDDRECNMTAEAFETLLEYDNLLQARSDAKSAHNTARFAMWVSAGMAAIQIIIALAQCNQAPGAAKGCSSIEDRRIQARPGR